MNLFPTRRLSLPSLALALACGAASAQTTWYVDDDGPFDPFPGVSIPGNPAFSDPDEDGSLQHPFDDVYKAVGAAANGDTVLVQPSNVIGYYALTQALDLNGKAITVESAGGPEVTVLDGTGIPGVSGVRIDSGEGPSTVLEGLTFQNFDRGSADGNSGGALFVSGASPTIRGCRFVANHAHRGGGVYLTASAARFEDCTFLANSAVWQGGGVHSDSGTQDYVRCTFDSNQANFGGGALFRTNAADIVEVTECLFVSNQALVSYGGALAKFDQGKIDVARSIFVGNSAPGDGSAAQVHGGGFFHECLFNGNSAGTGTINSDIGGSGGAGTVDVFGSTFTQNQGGAVTEMSGAMILRNSIAWNNMPFEIGAGVTVSYSDVLGGWGGSGNIDADPRFRDPFGKDGVLGTLDDDLSLRKGSPCIDAADTLELHSGPAWANLKLVPYPTDLAGSPRAIDHPAVPDTGVPSLGLTTDMGAFEFVALPDCNRVVNLQLKP